MTRNGTQKGANRAPSTRQWMTFKEFVQRHELYSDSAERRDPHKDTQPTTLSVPACDLIQTTLVILIFIGLLTLLRG